MSVILSGLPGRCVAIFVNRKGIGVTLVTGSAILLLGALDKAAFVDIATEVVIVFGFRVGYSVDSSGALAQVSSMSCRIRCHCRSNDKNRLTTTTESFAEEKLSAARCEVCVPSEDTAATLETFERPTGGNNSLTKVDTNALLRLIPQALKEEKTPLSMAWLE